jgi:hypothetical protein
MTRRLLDTDILSAIIKGHADGYELGIDAWRAG